MIVRSIEMDLPSGDIIKNAGLTKLKKKYPRSYQDIMIYITVNGFLDRRNKLWAAMEEISKIKNDKKALVMLRKEKKKYGASGMQDLLLDETGKALSPGFKRILDRKSLVKLIKEEKIHIHE